MRPMSCGVGWGGVWAVRVGGAGECVVAGRCGSTWGVLGGGRGSWVVWCGVVWVVWVARWGVGVVEKKCPYNFKP